MQYPSSIKNLIKQLSLLPSVGPKTAERYVFFLLKQNNEYIQTLAQMIAELKEKTKICSECFSICEGKLCEICQDKNRDKNTICIVSNTRDLMNFEATKTYKGLYHVIGANLSVINNINPTQLNLKTLQDRIKKLRIKEIIIALSPNLDGETTALYIAKNFAQNGLKMTRLSRGLPYGSDIEYMDDITLANALKFRNEIN